MITGIVREFPQGSGHSRHPLAGSRFPLPAGILMG